MPTNSGSTAPLALAEGFPPADRERWMAEVSRVLARGADLDAEALARRFDRVLRTPTHDGITLDPLYTAGDAPEAGAEGLPGFAPFTRGATPLRPGGTWDVRQVVRVSGDGSAAAGRAVAELERGAVSVELDLRDARTIDAALLDRVLDGVHLDAAPVGLWAGPRAAAAARALGAVCAERGVDPLRVAGALGIDPIGDHAESGGAAGPVADRLDEAAALARAVDGRNPGVRALAVDVARYHAAGGTQVQALGLALATGVAYLRALAGAGMDPAAAAAQIEFRVAAPPEQFPTIAAMRALRTCWSRVGEVAGLAPPDRAARIHAVPAVATLTRHDPWVNLLRGTVACFAAAVGGADVVTVAPYDDLSPDGPGELGRRMARNTQALLADESGVGRVVDPAGGSHFVEALTGRMAEAAWSWFQEIEGAGGVVAALGSGMVAERLAERWEERRRAIAHRRDAITGVSEFPLLEEDVPPAGESAAPGADTPFPALPTRRYAQDFELLRARSERHRGATGARPAVFLATLGRPADHIARATFAANLFAAGGIEALPGGDLGPEDDIAAAFAASGAPMACICSADPVYAERAADAAAALRAAGAARVYLAGAPGAGADADGLRAAGVDEFAHLGIDAVDLLTRALDTAGVAA